MSRAKVTGSIVKFPIFIHNGHKIVGIIFSHIIQDDAALKSNVFLPNENRFYGLGMLKRVAFPDLTPSKTTTTL